ncbi:hypothetical protein AVEN_98008-1 [Araneus ventricosus]|uniref:Mos1 transposase HTH domain-containing protein n=1 Tax=Araneus ventricosus TaxID=182803 RepID=A0A4Y2N5A5_ARAVE|nr:hypothetical protein AVEN_98008-1 [Araneus ventricosus]
MRSTRKKWCASWKLTPILKYAEQYAFRGQNVSLVQRFIMAVYGPHALSRPTTLKWCQQFEDGRTYLTDAARQGRPTAVRKHMRHSAAGGRYYSQQYRIW